MAVFNKFNEFVADLANGVHDFATDQLIVALTTGVPLATNAVLADLTPIAYTNLSSRNLITTSSTQTSGTYSLVLEDLVLTGEGAVANFRYVTVYNDTPTTPADPLIGWYDYGAGGVTLASGETLTIDFTEAQTLFDIV